MTGRTFTVESRIDIFDDEYGTKISLAPDRDGLGCVEISMTDGDVTKVMPCISPQMAQLLGKYLLNYKPYAETVPKEPTE